MIDDSEPCAVYRTQQIKSARKEHKCSECGRQIHIREPYLYCFLVYQGAAEHYHVCAHCQVAVKWLQHNCGGFLFNAVCEDIEEHIDGLAIGLRRLKYGMQRGWHRHGKLMAVPLAPADFSYSLRARKYQSNATTSDGKMPLMKD